MKRKLGCLALVGCLGLTLTGCKADSDDLDNQVEKVSEVIEKGDLFDKDYQIKGVMTVTVGEKTAKTKYHLERDEDNYWVKLEGNDEEEDFKLETWVGEKDDKHYAFYDDGEHKKYISIDSEEVNNVVDEALSALEGIGSNLKDMYDDLLPQLEEMSKVCKENNSKLTTCTIEKSLFGTVTVTMETKTTMMGSEQSIITSYSLRGGKLREITFKTVIGESTMEITTEYSYGNQIVKLPNTDDFTALKA